MKTKILSAIIVIILINSNNSNAQDVAAGNKIWYSNYTYIKLNSKFYLDNYLISSHDLKKNHQFGFIQTDLGINYKLSKKVHLFMAYSNAQYKYLNSYEYRYDKEPNMFNKFSVHRLGIGAKYRLKFMEHFRFNQKLVVQHYIPQLEKYKFRAVYSGKISFKHRKAPLQMTPYFQYFLYYYSGGKQFEKSLPELSFESEEDDFEVQGPLTKPSNGIHRYRLRAGVSFKPVPKFKPLSLVFYYAMQREFNMPGLGNDLNIKVDYQNKRLLPFNNFNIVGVQLNLIFN